MSQTIETVFPAGAGMNRLTDPDIRPPVRVPRRRGDEPLSFSPFLRGVGCSPQARG